MAVFKDCKGSSWTIEVNVSTIKRVRSQLSVDLLKPVDPKAEGDQLVERLFTDPVLIVDVLFVTLQEQLRPQGINEEEFIQRLGNGDIPLQARDLFLQEWELFFQSYNQPNHVKLIQAMKQRSAATVEVMGKLLEMAIAKIPSPESIDLEASLESILAHLPSVN